MELEIRQILVQILGFLLMLWVLKKFGWQPVLNVLEERKEKIKAEFKYIEDQKHEAEALRAEYERKLDGIEDEARQKMKEAIAEGQTIALEIQAKAQESVRDAHKKIQSDIHMEIAKAEGQLKERLVETVIATTEKLLRETLTENQHQQLIEEFIEEAKFK